LLHKVQIEGQFADLDKTGGFEPNQNPKIFKLVSSKK
jgi:hypothetical protein